MMPSSDPLPSRNLSAALAHAAHGRPVFPCDPKTKRPSIPKRAGGKGFHDATTDAGQIRAWWSQYPDAAVGMPTGAAVGVFVLDVDVKDGKVGEDTLSTLLEVFGSLPDTLETLTATGGRHIYFRHPRGGAQIPNKAGILGQGTETWGRGGYPEVPFRISPGGMLVTPDVDIRGDGGYVILPGSVMADGRSYEWEGSSDPEDGATIAEAPQWLLALVVQEPEQEVQAAQSEGQEIGEGRRNETLFRLGRSLRAKGLTEGAIVAALKVENESRCKPPLPESEVIATARSAAGKPPGRSERWERRQTEHDASAPPDLRVVAGTDFDARPSIRIRNGHLPEVVDELERYLIAAKADIFQHGTRLVRVGQWEAGSGPVQRPSGSGVLIDISPEWLADQATRLIRFERFDKRQDKWLPVDCPTKVAGTLLARVGSWRFPTLTGFVDSPTLDLMGRVVAKPGYDPESGLYVSRPPKMGEIAGTSLDQARGAGETLYEAVSTFPFVTSCDASACLALILTALLRRVLPAAPIGVVSASTPGTGKSLLVDVISSIVAGRQAAVAGIGHTPEELEKRIDALLLKGDGLCSLDNVDRAVKSDVLCQIATQPMKSIRVLALSKLVEAPTNVALYMTGNNLTLIGDLVRRCVVVNLDAACERPELREFDRDAIDYVMVRRSELIADALRISKAYLDAGCPPVKAPPFGSFATWDKMIRRPLMWIGWPDPLKPAESMREQDHELGSMRYFLSAWRAARQDPITAAELTEMVRSRVPTIGDGWKPEWPELTEAAIQVMGDSPKWGPRELGYRLRSHCGRLYGDLRIAKSQAGRGGVRWCVESIAKNYP